MQRYVDHVARLVLITYCTGLTAADCCCGVNINVGVFSSPCLDKQYIKFYTIVNYKNCFEFTLPLTWL